MTNKCTGIIGRIFGHKWHSLTNDSKKYASQNVRGVIAVMPKYAADEMLSGGWVVCQRCGAVTGEQ